LLSYAQRSSVPSFRDGELRHAGYIQSWIGLLKTDCRAFFTACSKAQAAADYLRGLALRDQQPTMAA